MNNFWDNQSLNKKTFIHSISNLSYDKNFSKEKSLIEKDIIVNLLESKNKIFNSCIEIGAGTCQWTYILSKISKSILITDTSKGMLEIGKKYLLDNYSKINIKSFIGDICKEINPLNAPYDLFFISGLILYLNKNQFSQLLKFISINATNNAIIILREPVGINKEYILDNVYSDELKTNYSALYRTEQTIINSFKSNNFKLETNEWLHPDNSKFNKWKETRLKLISFRRIK